MQQIADRVGRARHDGQPGRRRQVGSDSTRDLPAQALLRRRHDDCRRRRDRLGYDQAETARRSSPRKTSRTRLSDEEIVDEMASQGVKVARRTVTKYRQNLLIPSSRQRKQF